MPELPELVVMCEALESLVLGELIAGARVYRPGILKTVDPSLESLAGVSFSSVTRRGKHLILTCRNDLHVVIHLMVAGRLVLCQTNTTVTKATGFVISFEDGQDLRLVENGKTKRAKVHVVKRPEDVEWISGAGPEPLSEAFTLESLREAVHGRRQQIKKVITDQKSIAGIGTAYADEILFAAGISPIKYASTLDEEDAGRLFESIRKVLADAIESIREQSGETLLGGHKRDFLQIYKKTGQPCPACGGQIAEIRYAQKRTYYCPTCQSAGKTLSDRRSWLTR